MGRLAKRRPYWFHDIVMSPYDLAESVGVVWRNVFQDCRSHVRLEYAPQHLAIEPDVTPVMRVGVVGDIMDMHGRTLDLGADIPHFFADCDVLVGNFEATIAPRKTWIMQQRHDLRIIQSLHELFDPQRFYLSIANNHASDFDPLTFDCSCQALRDAGFHVFGLRDRPFVDIGTHLRVITGSMWTNMPGDRIADFDDIPQHLDGVRFNLLYPHWGYEMECNPRQEILELGEQLLQKADAVIGHHSHLPQPIRTSAIAGRHKILATSLGDFCCGGPTRCYDYGSIMKFSFGRRPTGEWTACDLDWRFIGMTRTKTVGRVTTRDSIPYLPSDRTASSKPSAC